VLNDVWTYQIDNRTWTWVSGDNVRQKVGVYGEKGNGSNTTMPGARRDAIAWYDSTKQEVWVFGGQGYDTTTYSGAHGYIYLLAKAETEITPKAF